ncbi:MAG: hypothetical protein GXY09_01040 [Bacteroidales bacterium]|nr:hypothetical protein [Bacteroidales bacterium]
MKTTHAKQKLMANTPIDTLNATNLDYITINDSRDRLKVATIIANIRGSSNVLYIGMSALVANMISLYERSTYTFRLTVIDHESISDTLGVFDLIIVDNVEEMVLSHLYDTKAEKLKKLSKGIPTLLIASIPLSIGDIHRLTPSPISVKRRVADEV